MKRASAIVRWRTVSVAMGCHCLLFVGLVRADVFSNVPEASDYQVVYQLAIPVKGVFQGTTPVPYSVNNSGSIASGSFDRVAYYLELANGSVTNWAYASMDAFTASAVQIGIPHATYNPVVFQQGVTNLAVFSSVSGVKTGSFDRGQIEMWHQSYSASNSTAVFAASDSTYDWGDMIGGTPSGYGSFQVHNPGSRQVVLAYNRWATSSGTSDDIGIGNSTGANPDWTFAGTTTNYTSRKLVVLVRPKRFAVTFTAVPMNQQVVPRNLATSKATVPISGSETVGGFDKAVLRIYRNGVVYGSDTVQVLSYSGGSASFSFNPVIPAELASYTFELYLQTGSTLRLVRRVSDVVAGDVFLWYGQSNAEAMMRTGSASGYASSWVRTFGMNSDYGNVTMAYLFWVQADGDGGEESAAGIGQWALVVGRKIVDTYGIPVAILNGARGGYSMPKLQRDNANPDALDNSGGVYRVYNRLRYRTIQAGVAGNVRGIFYYQGEADYDNTAQHTNGFASLVSSWKLDYPAIERIFETQLHVGCGVTRELPELRDAQRRFEDVYSTVRMMSVNGLTHAGCHYPFVGGYETHGLNVFRQVARELYGATDTPDIDPPNPDRVEVANAAGDRLRVVLRKPGAAITVDAAALVDFRVQGSGLTTNTLPSSATVTNGGIELQYGQNVSAATNLAYLAHVGSAGGWVRNGNGVGLLAFSEPVAAKAAANEWDGGGADALWDTANNWTNNSTPAFGNTLDVYFNTVGAANLANALGDNRTIRSLTFTADADSNVTICTADSTSNVTARTLTFDTQAATGNAMITVNSGAAGSFTIGAGGIGSVALADDLVVAHNGSGALTINASITGDKGITKAGTGVLSLTTASANTYSGGTTIKDNGGTLLI
ncbi:MAG: autotransporter-associated beta strand repeat-containing protein, partial [Verrucomicrobiae bacterium]